METKIAGFCLCLAVYTVWTGVASGSVVKAVLPAKCPLDYRRRVETCIMEAQLAPQAGGGISLVVNKDKVVDLCDRGLLMKTIDCLKEIRSRCALNESVVHDLDRLYSVTNWQQAARLLCHDPQLDTSTTTVSNQTQQMHINTTQESSMPSDVSSPGLSSTSDSDPNLTHSFTTVVYPRTRK
ncbi:hypothetical protein ACOMHN_053749 [Nucella lapillus]